MSDTDLTAEAERLARKLYTREPYKHPLQIAAETPVSDAQMLGDTVLVLGQGDYPTLRHLADETRRLQDQAASTMRALAARAEAAEARNTQGSEALAQCRDLLRFNIESVVSLKDKLSQAEAEVARFREHEGGRGMSKAKTFNNWFGMKCRLQYCGGRPDTTDRGTAAWRCDECGKAHYLTDEDRAVVRRIIDRESAERTVRLAPDAPETAHSRSVAGKSGSGGVFCRPDVKAASGRAFSDMDGGDDE